MGGLGSDTGMLVEARKNPLIYTFIILIGIVILALVLLQLFIYYINKKHSSPEWIEAHKSSPTKKSTAKKISKEAELTSAEDKLLWKFCRNYLVPNLEYTVKNLAQLDTFVKAFFEDLSNIPTSEETIANLFSIRFKLEKYKESSSFITSTQHLKPGQEFFYFENGKKYIFIIAENQKNNLLLTVPEALSGDNKPAPLSKLNISFNTKTNISYGFVLRILRYEKTKDDKELLVASHSTNLKPVQRRMAKRLNVNCECNFSAVTVTEDRHKRLSYEIKENKYKGAIKDVSATGCRMNCNLPLKQKQHIHVDFDLGGKIQCQAIGLIIQTNKAQDGNYYVVHIQFIKIEPKIKNTINAYIFGYL